MLDQTPFASYCFGWKDESSNLLLVEEYGMYFLISNCHLFTGGLPGGCGFFYNHSDNPVAEFIRDFDNKELIIKSLKSIKANDEITIQRKNK